MNDGYTIHNPSRFLSRETIARINATGVDLYEYVSNIDNKLRIRGEADLADTMLQEIRNSIDESAERHADRERRRNMPASCPDAWSF